MVRIKNQLNTMPKGGAFFKTYSTNFALVMRKTRPDVQILEPVYACPLCQRFFGEKYLFNQQANYLTIEHIPPESVGGKSGVLTCKECNSTHGYKLDSQLFDRMKANRVMSRTPGTSLNTRFEIGGKILTDGEIKIRPDSTLEFFFDGKRTNPLYKRDIVQMLQGRTSETQISFTFRKGKDEHVGLSLLRIAYLLAFKQLGYAFALTRSAQKIASLIVKEAHESSHPYQLRGPLPEECRGIYIISEPSDLHSYMVVFDLSLDGYKEKHAVILPGAHDDNLEVYDHLSVHSETGSMKLYFFEVPEVDYLNDEQLCLTPYLNWF